MAKKVRFKVEANWSEEEVAQKVATVIGGADTLKICPPFRKESGYRWQLDATNDWWMDTDPETGEYILVYRYASGHNDKAIKAIEGLRDYLEWIFGR